MRMAEQESSWVRRGLLDHQDDSPCLLDAIYTHLIF